MGNILAKLWTPRRNTSNTNCHTGVAELKLDADEPTNEIAPATSSILSVGTTSDKSQSKNSTEPPVEKLSSQLDEPLAEAATCLVPEATDVLECIQGSKPPAEPIISEKDVDFIEEDKQVLAESFPTAIATQDMDLAREELKSPEPPIEKPSSQIGEAATCLIPEAADVLECVQTEPLEQDPHSSNVAEMITSEAQVKDTVMSSVEKEFTIPEDSQPLVEAIISERDVDFIEEDKQVLTESFPTSTATPDMDLAREEFKDECFGHEEILSAHQDELQTPSSPEPPVEKPSTQLDEPLAEAATCLVPEATDVLECVQSELLEQEPHCPIVAGMISSEEQVEDAVMSSEETEFTLPEDSQPPVEPIISESDVNFIEEDKQVLVESFPTAIATQDVDLTHKELKDEGFGHEEILSTQQYEPQTPSQEPHSPIVAGVISFEGQVEDMAMSSEETESALLEDSQLLVGAIISDFIEEDKQVLAESFPTAIVTHDIDLAHEEIKDEGFGHEEILSTQQDEPQTPSSEPLEQEPRFPNVAGMLSSEGQVEDVAMSSKEKEFTLSEDSQHPVDSIISARDVDFIEEDKQVLAESFRTAIATQDMDLAHEEYKEEGLGHEEILSACQDVPQTPSQEVIVSEEVLSALQSELQTPSEGLLMEDILSSLQDKLQSPSSEDVAMQHLADVTPAVADSGDTIEQAVVKEGHGDDHDQLANITLDVLKSETKTKTVISNGNQPDENGSLTNGHSTRPLEEQHSLKDGHAVTVKVDDPTVSYDEVTAHPVDDIFMKDNVM